MLYGQMFYELTVPVPHLYKCTEKSSTNILLNFSVFHARNSKLQIIWWSVNNDKILLSMVHFLISFFIISIVQKSLCCKIFSNWSYSLMGSILTYCTTEVWSTQVHALIWGSLPFPSFLSDPFLFLLKLSY